MKFNRIIKTIFLLEFVKGLNIAIKSALINSIRKIVLINREKFINYLTGNKSK